LETVSKSRVPAQRQEKEKQTKESTVGKETFIVRRNF
jgi:hypothetical protein